MVDFIGHSRVADDRSGDTLVEEARVQKKLEVIPLRLHLSAVNVDNVTEKLEGVEGDTDRQCDLRHNLRDME